MPRYIVKLEEDGFIEWSTIVDAPITYLMKKQEMIDYLIFEYGNSERDQAIKRVERADFHGSSAVPEESADDIIAGNRAGINETELTKEQLIQRLKNENPNRS